MTLVEVNTLDDALDGLVDRRVLANDVGRLAAQLESQLLARAGHRLGDDLAHLGRAGESELVDVRMVDDGRAGVAESGDDVDHTFGQVGFGENLRQVHGGDGRGLGRLKHAGVSAGQGGSEFPRGHEQREIPRDDLSGHAEGLRFAPGKSVVEFVRPPRVVEKVRGDERQVDITALADGFAAVEGFNHRKIAHLFLQEAGDAEEIFAALASRHFAPGLFVGAAGGLDRFVHIGRGALCDFGVLFFGGRIDRGEIFTRRWFDKFAADEEFVARLDFDVGVNFRSGRIIPAFVEAQMTVAHRNNGRVRCRGDEGGHAGGEFLGFFAHGREK